MRVISMIFSMTVLLVGCNSTVQQPIPSEHTSKADDLHFEDKYYLDIWEFTITDSSKIKRIGKIEKANRLIKGSDIYEIDGYPKHNFIAVEDKESITGYSIYAEYKGDGKPIPFPHNITYPKVKEIQVYKDKELINVIEGNRVKEFITLFEQKGTHNQFLWDRPAQYAVVFSTDTAFGYKYDIFEKDGEFGFPQSESKLPSEIRDYLIPKK